MRISDWSSDVCSSDLTKYKQRLADTYDSLGQLQYKQGNLAGAECYYAAERALLRALVVDDPRNNVTRAYLAAADTFYAHEIGRASCRERVCQYVSITADAVSLKNKYIQKQSNI